MEFCSVNPANDEVVARYPTLDSAAASEILAGREAAFQRWRRVPIEEKSQAFHRAAQILRENAEVGARLAALEMGKPLAEGRGEIEKCAKVCDYFAEKSHKFLTRQLIPTEAKDSFVSFQPIGCILAIMPWNFPFWQVFRVVAPTMMAGNTVLLKHAPNVTGCARLIERILREAGFPEGAFDVLLADLDVVEQTIAHPGIAGVTLTGSTRAGRAVAATAGKYLKKVVLELGGSDPYVILEDADIEAAARACVASRLINGGQSCIAAKRFIAVDAVRDAFTDAVYNLMQAKTYGDPLAGDYDIGPMARKDLRDELHRQVEGGVAAGARLILGGTKPEGTGCFYPPSLFVDVPEDSPPFKEEMFGPVASIIAARDEADAVRLANQSEFGLGAAVFTADRERGRRIAEQELHAGACFVNDFVRSDQRLPFGGVKDSGYGRELSIFGIREFVNVKTIWVQ